MSDTNFDVEFCRSQFPPLKNGWRYFENAGGSYVPEPVMNEMWRYMCESQCQPDWPNAPSRAALEQIERSRRLVSTMLNVSPDEIIIGPSTTMNVYVLSHALRPLFSPGDEVIVTNQDHEANGGAWRRLKESGIVVQEWRIDPETGDLNTDDLAALLGEKTRLVCFPHVSNIVGSYNDVAVITKMAHDAGAMVCVDGVATVAHLMPDLAALDVDFYLLSFYKLYGPHQALLYAKRRHIEAAANQNHFFHQNSGAAKLNPGGMNYEACASLAGIVTYLDSIHAAHFATPEQDLRKRTQAVYELFRAQESRLMAPLVDYLGARNDVRLIGRCTADDERRAPTFSVTVRGREPEEIALALADQRIAAGHGHFYGYRCVEALGIDPDKGVLRLSMVHYNTLEEVEHLIGALEKVL